MLITVIATICIANSDVCRDEVVTTSAIDERATMQYCSVMGQPALADWISDHFPGYRLAGWKCDSGHRGTPV